MSELHCVEGTIVSGDKTGYRIRVEDDQENTGGFLIILWPPKDETGGGDHWVERFEHIQEGLNQLGWQVKWDQPLESLRSARTRR